MTKLTVFIAFSLISNSAFAQKLERMNSILVEIGGPVVVGAGLSYERTFVFLDKHRLAGRIGAGLVTSFTEPTANFGASYIFGRKSGIEIGTNYLIGYDISNFKTDELVDYENGPQMLIGYRYQNYKSGFLLRLYWVPPVGCCGSYIPIYSGMSLGYSF